MKNEQDGGRTKEKETSAAVDSAGTSVEVWEKVKIKLNEYLSADAFSRWFKSAELIEDDERGPAVIGVNSDMQQIWIETNYMDEVRAAFAEGAGIHTQAFIRVLGEEVAPSVKKVARGSASVSEQVKVVKQDEESPKTVALERKLKKMEAFVPLLMQSMQWIQFMQKNLELKQKSF